MEADLKARVRPVVRQALAHAPSGIARALAELPWNQYASENEALAITTLFEEQGRAGVATDALDVVAALFLGIDVEASVIWPLPARPSRERPLPTGEGDLLVEGIALRCVCDGRTVLVPADGCLHVLTRSSITETRLQAGEDATWVSVRGRGLSAGVSGSWHEIEGRARLAVASELVGLSHRMLDVVVNQFSTRERFGRPIGSTHAVQLRLAEAYAEIVGAQTLIAAAWQEGSAASAAWAKTAAARAQDAVAKHAIEMCGPNRLSGGHELHRLARRGSVLDALLGRVPADQARLGRERLAAQLGRTLLPPVPVGAVEG